MTRATTEQDLRFLYGNVKKMLQSDSIQSLYKCLIEDLAEFVGFERIMVLRRKPGHDSLEIRFIHGFQNPLSIKQSVPLAEVNGLLHQTYTDREALAVYDFPEKLSPTDAESRWNAILSDFSRDEEQPNRRTKINLCFSNSPSDTGEGNSPDQFTSHPITTIEKPDPFLFSLLGAPPSFLLLPMCNRENFYGYVLVDNGQSSTDISYDRIRHACTIVHHATLSMQCIIDRQKTLESISEQVDEADRKKQFYQNIFQNLRSGLVTIDRDMKITEANRAAANMLGYDDHELPGHPINHVFADQQVIEHYSFVDLSKAIEADMGILPEISIQKKDGATFPAEVYFSIITDSSNTISCISCAFRDLTNRKTLEQGLARVDKLASLGEMAAGMAHEIKNPLAGIAGALQIISKNYQEESTHQYIFNEVLAQVKRIDSFVNDLLNFARPGKTKFMRIDLRKILNNTLRLLGSQAREQQTAISMDLCDTPHLVMGDEGQLQQVFFNIMNNAIDTMDKGGELTITSCCERYPIQAHSQGKSLPLCDSPHGMIKICFVDTGKGIEPQMLESIFNPFHTTKSNGKGLGLPIASRIVEQHGGTITVQSKLGVGSSFTVQLPLCGKVES